MAPVDHITLEYAMRVVKELYNPKLELLGGVRVELSGGSGYIYWGFCHGQLHVPPPLEPIRREMYD